MPQRVFVVSQDAKFLEAMVLEWKAGGDLPELECIQPRPEMLLPRASAAILDGPCGVPMLSGKVALALLVCAASGSGGKTAVTAAKLLTADAGTQILRLPRQEGWVALAAAMVRESVLRQQAQARALELELRLREGGDDCSLEEMSATARHDLANALTAALGYCELMLMEKQLAKKTRLRVETVYASLRRAELLLRFMLQKSPATPPLSGEGPLVVAAPMIRTVPDAVTAPVAGLLPGNEPVTPADGNEFRGALCSRKC